MNKEHKPLKVDKKKFDAFIANYPNKLEANMTTIIEPPVLNWNDFSSGKIWPESVVCFKYCNKDYKKEDDYYINPEYMEKNDHD